MVSKKYQENIWELLHQTHMSICLLSSLSHHFPCFGVRWENCGNSWKKLHFGPEGTKRWLPVTLTGYEPLTVPVNLLPLLGQPRVWVISHTPSHFDLWNALALIYLYLFFFFFFKIHRFNWMWALPENWSLHSFYYVHKLVIYIDLHMIGA